MTKKDKILKLFNEAEWIESLGGRKTKIIVYGDFLKAGLNPTIEYQETYCDVIYARQILNKLGYTVLIGANFNVYSKQPIESL